MESYRLSVLEMLEAESIHIVREVAAQFERPVVLYSVGKDSSVLVRLLQKAFAPGRIPFPLLHIDTGMKVPEMYEFRDRYCREIGAELHVHRSCDGGNEKVNPFRLGTVRCCGILKTQGLLNALRAGGYDAALGGARRDEERSRAKERIFSFRDAHGQWDPRGQRPELWDLYNGRIGPGESMRVFPMSNWTELDVWAYILQESIPVVPMYFAAERAVVRRGGQLIPLEGPISLRDGERAETVWCRFRTLGCYPCTGAIASRAGSVPEIIEELLEAENSERVTRVIDHDVDASMEQKKRDGYF